MSHKSIPSDFIKSVLHNGVGRYVCQLQRLTIKFCKSHASSRGVRDFIENDLLEFTRNNPGIVVYLQPQRHKDPCLVGEYLNQNVVNLPAANQSRIDLCKWVEHLRSRSGIEIVRLRKPWHTDNPSVQGVWTPFTSVDTSLASARFPDPVRYAVRSPEETATERLARMKIGAGVARGDTNKLISAKSKSTKDVKETSV